MVVYYNKIIVFVWYQLLWIGLDSLNDVVASLFWFPDLFGFCWVVWGFFCLF